jgi:quinol monooxygenase YgiN
MIVVVGSVQVKDGCLPQVLELSVEHVNRSRSEPGCISHCVSQDAQDPKRLLFVEEWSDQAALLQHFQVPESKAFAKQLAGYAAQTPSMVVYNATAVEL